LSVCLLLQLHVDQTVSVSENRRLHAACQKHRQRRAAHLSMIRRKLSWKRMAVRILTTQKQQLHQLMHVRKEPSQSQHQNA